MTGGGEGREGGNSEQTRAILEAKTLNTGRNLSPPVLYIFDPYQNEGSWHQIAQLPTEKDCSIQKS